MIVLYVTHHGFGHATRAAALAAALKAARPSLELEIRSAAPEWIFRETCPGASLVFRDVDRGLAQRDALDVDLEASLAAHLAWAASWDTIVEREARELRARGARMVVADIAPLAFAAAARAGIPSVGVSNFCWDWILEPYAAADSRWEPVRRLYGGAYARAEAVLRLPLHGEFPAFRRVIDVPLLCRLGESTPESWRAERGLQRDRRPMVLIAFGGFGVGPIALAAGEDLSGYLFAGFGPKPEGLNANWVALTGGTSYDQLSTMAACDVVISKPGYGIISEALGHGKRMLYIPRSDYREIGPLVHGLESRGACGALSREDFTAGRWRAALDGLLESAVPARVPNEGGRVAARWLLRRLDGETP